jgi:beta-galactosidase
VACAHYQLGADQWHRICTDGYPGALRDVLGIRIEESHPLHPAASVTLTTADAKLTGQLWTERLRAEGSEVLASYSGGPLTGVPAVTRHAFGAGTAWYLSTLLAPAT